MKTQNTLENKARFFAQYFGQHVLYFSSDFLRKIDNLTLDSIENDDFLELKPLSQISDDDYNKLHNVTGYIIEDRVVNVGNNSVTIYHKWNDKDMKNGFGHSASTIYYDSLNQLGCDYLRSKGYALPYMDLSSKIS